MIGKQESKQAFKCDIHSIYTALNDRWFSSMAMAMMWLHFTGNDFMIDDELTIWRGKYFNIHYFLLRLLNQIKLTVMPCDDDNIVKWLKSAIWMGRLLGSWCSRWVEFQCAYHIPYTEMLWMYTSLNNYNVLQFGRLLSMFVIYLCICMQVYSF